MSDEPSEPKKEDLSEDVARLYSHARVPGSQYTGYTASRKQVQKGFRDRIARAHAERAGLGPTRVARPPAIDRPAAGAGPAAAASPLRTPELSEFASILFAASKLPGLESPAAPVRRQDLRRQDRLQPVPAESAEEPRFAPPPGFAERAPALLVFSLVDGVGKTCLVATLGRALSALGEEVLVADTALGGSLSSYFGAREGRPGSVRTFRPFPFSARALDLEQERVPIQLLHLDAEQFPRFASGQDLLLGKLVQESRSRDRLLIDVATAGREFHRLLALQPAILVLLLPDGQAMANVDAIESLLPAPEPDNLEPQAFFLLNQFDVADGQHREVRETLQRRLGESLLPFVLHSSATVEQARTEGLTVMDHAPQSALAEDYRQLAAWLRGLVAPNEAPVRVAQAARA